MLERDGPRHGVGQRAPLRVSRHAKRTPRARQGHAKGTLRPRRCGNVAAILELDEHLQKEFIIFEAAPQETRGIPSKKPVADYFL